MQRLLGKFAVCVRRDGVQPERFFRGFPGLIATSQCSQELGKPGVIPSLVGIKVDGPAGEGNGFREGSPVVRFLEQLFVGKSENPGSGMVIGSPWDKFSGVGVELLGPLLRRRR